MHKGSICFTLAGAILLASCSFGPRLQSAMPNVRSIPVLAGLSPAESLARARTYLASRQYGLAIELFRAAGRDRALELDSLNGLAIAYDGIGRPDLAERYFERALALRTDDPRTRRNLAAFYEASGQSHKGAALLADAKVRPAQRAEVTVAADAPLRSLSLAAADATDRGVALRQPSPLGGAFRPLLVKAAYADAIAPASVLDAAPDDSSIICLIDPEARQSSGSDDGVAMFRITIGEVFVASQPVGTSCTVTAPAPAALKPQAMSNMEYLGLVAAYLDQMNRLHQFAQLAIPSIPAVS